LPLEVKDGAQQPTYAAIDKNKKQVRAAFLVSPAILEPGTVATFTAEPVADPQARCTWLFGDGAASTGRQVRHRFPDAMGTQLDGTAANGAGRFRVLLQVEDKQANQDWAEQGVVVVGKWHDATGPAPAQPAIPGANTKNATAKPATVPGLDYQIYPGTWPELPVFATETPVISGAASNLAAADAGGFTRFAVTYDGFIEVPVDGGYTFHVLSRDGVRLILDGLPLAQTGPPFVEVCGSPINALRYALGTIGLRAGKHRLRLEALESMSPGSPRLLWEGPGITLADVPAKAFSHLNQAAVVPKPSVPISTVGP